MSVDTPGAVRWTLEYSHARHGARLVLLAIAFRGDESTVPISDLAAMTHRARYRCQEDHEHAPHRMCTPDALPVNEVTEHLHSSGDCKCGSYAHVGELEETRFFYPEAARQIDRLEEEATAAGIRACVWGHAPPADKAVPAEEMRRDSAAEAIPFLCSRCVPFPGQEPLTGWPAFDTSTERKTA